MLDQLLQSEPFDFVAPQDKQFILDFSHAMEEMGYTFGNQIVDGICWGKYMMIFTKAGVQSKKVYARIYMRAHSISLRFFFSDVTKHAAYISQAPDPIKRVFTGDQAACRHDRQAPCRFQKTYTIDGVFYEKCNGETFEFRQPKMENLKDYLDLFTTFYPVRRKKH